MLRLNTLFFGLLFSTSIGMAGDHQPAVAVCRFLDDKDAAVSLSFDDGSVDHLSHAAPLLEKYGYRGTFYAVIKWTEAATNGTAASPTRRYLTWDGLRKLADAGHEIGNHSMTHYQLFKAKDRAELEKEIVAPLAIFQEHLGFQPLTFCYPGNGKTAEIVTLTEETHLGSLKGHRRMVGDQHYDLDKNAAWLDELIARKQSDNAMFHGIVPDGGGWRPFADISVFDGVLKQFKERQQKLWVCPVIDLVAYQQAAKAAKVATAMDKGAFRISVNYPESTAETVRRSPLSLRIADCPDHWRILPQGPTEEKEPPTLIRKGTDAILTFRPHKGPVILGPAH